MKSILSAVKNLSTKAAASQWSQVEAQLLKSAGEFDRETFVEAANRFAEAKQGTPEYWKSVQNQTLKHFNTFNKDEIANLALAIGSNDNPIDPVVEKKLLASLNYIVKQTIEDEKSANPYWESEFTSYIDSGLAPMMRYLAYSQASEKHAQPRGFYNAPALVEFNDTFDAFTEYVNSKEATAEAEGLAQAEGGEKELPSDDEGHIILNESWAEEQKEFERVFAKELQENAANEKEDIFNILKRK